MIIHPELPPKAGYVEVEVDGVRRYRNIETGLLYGQEPHDPTTEDRVAALESENKTLKAQVSALTDQNDFQEELIVELAGVVYA